MNTALVDFLMGSRDANHARLKAIADQAAANYITKKASLNSYIGTLTQEHGLNDEQIRRVCEMANHVVFSHLYKTAADKYVTFPVADAKVVIADVRGGDVKAVLPTPPIAGSYVPGQDSVGDVLDLLFPVKTAGNELPDVRSYEKTALFRKLRGLVGHAESEVQSLEFRLKEVEGEFYGHLKTAVLEGYSRKSLAGALSYVAPSPAYAEAVVGYFVPKLEKIGALRRATNDDPFVPDVSHPLFTSFEKLARASEAYLSAKETLTQYRKASEVVFKEIRSAA